MKHLCLVFVASLLAASVSASAADNNPRVLKAKYAKKAVVVDGRLDDEVWKAAEPCELLLPEKPFGTDDFMQMRYGNEIKERGFVKVAWDDTNFYVAAEFFDSDVVAEGEADQEHHYSKGDLLEMFLKPVDDTWYWELYATPKNMKTSLFFPSRGRLGLPSMDKTVIDFKVAAHCEGTLDKWDDVDKKWTVEVAIPIKNLLYTPNVKFGPGSKWKMLAARYNYSRYLINKELSAFPRLSRSNFHLQEEYGDLEFEPKK